MLLLHGRHAAVHFGQWLFAVAPNASLIRRMRCVPPGLARSPLTTPATRSEEAVQSRKPQSTQGPTRLCELARCKRSTLLRTNEAVRAMEGCVCPPVYVPNQDAKGMRSIALLVLCARCLARPGQSNSMLDCNITRP